MIRSACDARRTSAGGESFGESFASAAELAALAERVSLAETVAERAGAAALSPSRDKKRTSRDSAPLRDGTARRRARRGAAEAARRRRRFARARRARASSSFSVAEDEPQPPLSKSPREIGVEFVSLEHSVGGQRDRPSSCAPLDAPLRRAAGGDGGAETRHLRGTRGVRSPRRRRRGRLRAV